MSSSVSKEVPVSTPVNLDEAFKHSLVSQETLIRPSR